MLDHLDEEMVFASARKLGVELLRNEDGDLVAPLSVFADALQTTEDEIKARLASRGVRMVLVPEMKLHKATN